MKAKVLLFAAAIAIIATSCGKKWKEPARVNFNFVVQTKKSAPEGTPAAINIDAGAAVLTNVEFAGVRKQGEAVNFQNSPNTSIDLSTGNIISSVYYDIPQGRYTSMNLKLSFSPNTTNTNGILMKGTYTLTNMQIIPVQFELKISQIFNVSVKENDGSDEVVLVKDSPRNLKIKINMNEWLAAITPAMFEAATTQNVSGQNTIVINELNNSNIYSGIYNRISNGAGVTAQFE